MTSDDDGPFMHFAVHSQEHKQHVTETKVLKSVAAVLVTVTDDIKKTYGSVAAVVAQLDATISQLKEDAGKEANASAAAAAAAAATNEGDSGSGGSGSGSSADRVSILATELGKALGAYSGGAEAAGVVATGEGRGMRSMQRRMAF